MGVDGAHSGFDAGPVTSGGSDTPPGGKEGRPEEASGPPYPEKGVKETDTPPGGEEGRPEEASGPPYPEEGTEETALRPDVSHLSADLALPPEGTEGSGTRPEGHTRRDPEGRKPGDSIGSGDPLIGQVVLERYRIERRIGAGGMGAVYAGVQLAVDREVALKVLRSDLMANEHVRQRFRREAEIIGRLCHPNTIALIDYGETREGLAIMVTELLRGMPLNDRLKADGPMDLLEVLDLGESVSRSLAEAHSRGLVHRDLKPANIFLVDMGESTVVKVLDFGIARLLDEESTRLTTTGQVFGTPRYMAPEQAMSTASVDARADLYSLGLILYEGLVGQPPFVAQTSFQYLSAHTTQAPPKLRARYPAAPAELEALIDACLAKDPEQRPSSADALAEALAEIRTSVAREFRAGSGRPTEGFGEIVSAPSKTSSSRFRSRTLLAAGFLAVVVFAMAAWLGVGRGHRVEFEPLPVENGLARADSDPSPAGEAAPAEPDAGSPPGPGGASGSSSPVSGEAKGESPPGTHQKSEEGVGSAPGVDDGEVDAPPKAGGDAGLAASGKALDRRSQPRRRRRARPDAGERRAEAPVGTGAVTGPRGLVLDVEEGPSSDLVALARGCERSVWRGLARLNTRACPEGCAVLVDEQCAGRTPAVERALPPGRRVVAVVCEDRVLRRRTMTFRAQKTSELSCR